MADDRPMLAGGERLIRSIERGPSGGGEKYHPRTLDEAKALLLPQVDLLTSAVAALEPELRGDRVVFQATVLPNYLAASYFPTDLLRSLDLVPIGARRATAMYRTATR